MTAEVVSIGTELLLGQTIDSNAALLGARIAELGVSCYRRQTVGDNLSRCVEALRTALDRADVVITIGGLGPTQDDLTRDAIAEALGDPLHQDEAIVEHLRTVFAHRRIPWVDSQLRQAQRPDCATPIPNPNGTAPGLICEKDGKVVIALPGPPNEFVPMVEGPVRDYLAKRATGFTIHSRIVRVCSMGESVVEHTLRDLMDQESPTVAPYAKLGEVHVRVTARAADREAAEALLAPTLVEIESRLGRHAFGHDDVSLEEAVIGAFRERKQTLSVAESLTGGGIGARLTSVAGASKVFLGGAIAYNRDLKQALLGIPTSVIRQFGTVSEECAKAMAEGAHRAFGSDVALAVTGNAGPDVDGEGAPVGRVFLAVAGPGGTTVDRHDFVGGRAAVRQRTAQAALAKLWFLE
ncbi:MAG: competence/damage-inducible protein A [Fimbriimonadaceae bacterium]|nr:competence/damage-inducible protein A [Fimbriimonadaceae bacterium]